MVVIKFIEILATVMFIPILIMIFGGLAQDIQRQLIQDIQREVED
jgi:hypothetical protein